MANEAKKTEHAGSKKGPALIGDAKSMPRKESNRRRREDGKKAATKDEGSRDEDVER